MAFVRDIGRCKDNRSKTGGGEPLHKLEKDDIGTVELIRAMGEEQSERGHGWGS
jgi:hypothetical protein